MGQADILREHIDGAAGFRAGFSNLPGDIDWPAYVAKLTPSRTVSERSPAR